MNSNLSDDAINAAVFIACKLNNTRYFDELSIHPCFNVNLQNHEGRTCLMQAAYGGHTEIVRKLLFNHKDIDPFLKDSRGRVASMYACKRGHVDVINVFLEFNPETCFIPDNEGYTSYMVAARKGHLSILQALYTKDSPTDKCCRINDSTNKGTTVLMIAAQFCHAHIVRFLLDHKVCIELNQQNNEGATALMFAVLGKSALIVDWLLEEGSVKTHKSNSGITALDIARRKGYSLIEEILL